MATQSPPPSSPPNENPQAPVLEAPKPANMDEKDAKEDVVDESKKPLFFISEPLREDQVQNAVKFLSHPKVRGSPVIYRRSFLEKKGLTKEEIDEAFRRVPDPSSNATNVEAPSIVPAQQAKPSTTLQPQPPIQASQTALAPVGSASVASELMRSRFHWSHALFAIGVLAASGAGTALLFKNLMVPRLKGWIRKVVAEANETDIGAEPKSKLADEAAEAAKTAASAAAIIAKASQDLLSAKNEERKYFEAFMGALDVQVKEMKAMSDSIHRLESRRDNGYYQDKPAGDFIQSTSVNGPANNLWRNSQHVHVNGTPNTDFGEVRPSSTSVPVEPVSAAYSRPYMPGKITTVAQRMEKPPGVMPWEAAQLSRERRSYDLQSQPTDEDLSSKVQDTFGPSSHVNGKSEDSSEPWWRKKSVKITEIEPEGAESRQFTYVNDSPERPKQRSWVPPQPPTVVMPEAAAAIRHPKPSAQKQLSEDERSVVNSDNGEDGGAVGAVNSLVEVENLSDKPVEANQSEIQEER